MVHSYYLLSSTLSGYKVGNVFIPISTCMHLVFIKPLDSIILNKNKVSNRGR